MRYVIDADRRGKRTHVVTFDSITEHVRTVVGEWDRPDPPAMFDPTHSHPRCGDFFYLDHARVYGDHYWPSYMTRRNWLGREDLNGWGDLRRAVREPWDLGMSAVADLRREIGAVELPVPVSIRRRAQWADDPGGTFDLDRYWDGQPAFRVTTNRHAIGRQFVTLMVNNDITRSTTYRTAYWRSVVGAVVAERLEDAGYSVEIVVYSANGDVLARAPERGIDDEQNAVVATWVKRFEDPVNIPAVVVAGSPWYMRIVKFATLHIIPGERTGEAYGYVDTLDPDLSKYFTPNADVHVIDDVWTAGAAADEARGILERYAAPAGRAHARAGTTDEEDDGDD